MRVPETVPSLTHSSSPLIPLLALKIHLLPSFTPVPEAEPPCTVLMSFKTRVPLGEPSVIQISVPVSGVVIV